MNSKGNGWSLAALCTVPFIMVLGNSMLIPVLTDLQAALHVGKTQAGLMITAFSIPAAIVILFTGYLTDRFGRKIVMVPSITLYAIGGVLAGLSAWLLKDRAFWFIFGGRVVQGLGAAGTAPVAMAAAGDLFKENRTRALGALEASNGLGKVLSPIIGAAIGLIVWWAVFWGFAVMALLAAAFVWFACKEPEYEKATGSVSKYLSRVGGVFKKQGMSLVAAIWGGTVALFVLFGVLFFLGEYLEDKYSMDGIPKGLVIAIPVLAMSVTSFFTGSFMQKHKPLIKPAIVTGFAVGAVGLLAVPLLRADWALFTGITLLGFGTGLVLPGLTSLITVSAASEERGAITGIYGSVRFFGVAMGPPLYGYLMGRNKYLPFWLSAILVGATALVALLFIRGARVQGGTGGGGEQESGKAQAWQPPAHLPKGTRQPLR